MIAFGETQRLYAGAVEGIGGIAAEAQQAIGATTAAQVSNQPRRRFSTS
jgi:hypothetical protein